MGHPIFVKSIVTKLEVISPYLRYDASEIEQMLIKKYYFRLPPKPLFNIHHDLKNIEDPYEKIEVIGLENNSLNAGQNTEVTVCVLGISISDSDLTRFYSCEKPNRGCAEYY